MIPSFEVTARSTLFRGRRSGTEKPAEFLADAINSDARIWDVVGERTIVVQAFRIGVVEPDLLKGQVSRREIQSQKPILVVDGSGDVGIGINIGDLLTNLPFVTLLPPDPFLYPVSAIVCRIVVEKPSAWAVVKVLRIDGSHAVTVEFVERIIIRSLGKRDVALHLYVG